MGNIVTDTASASKAAFVSALRKLGSKSRRSSSNSGDDTAFSDRPSVSANSDSDLDRAMYGAAKYDEDLAAGKIARSNALMAEDASPSQAQHEQYTAGFTGTDATAGMCFVHTCRHAPIHSLACTLHLLACTPARCSIHVALHGYKLLGQHTQCWSLSLLYYHCMPVHALPYLILSRGMRA